MSRFGVKELVALGTLATAPVAIAQDQNRPHLPIQNLGEDTFKKVDFVINEDSVAVDCSPDWAKAATRHGFHVYMDETGRCFAWKETYRFLASDSTLGPILIPTEEDPSSASCIAVHTYFDSFTQDDREHYVINSRDVVEHNVDCSNVRGAEAEQTVFPAVPVYDEAESLPTEGSFALVDEQIVRGSQILLPVRLGMSESELDPKLDNSNHLIVRNAKGVSVYKKLKTVEYDASLGRLVGLPMGEEDQNQCKISVAYENTFAKEGQRYFVIYDDFRTKDDSCEDAAHQPTSKAPKTKKVTHAATESDGTRTLNASALLGADIEETSLTNLGYTTSGVLAASVNPLVGAPKLHVGAVGSFIASPEGSGLEGVNGMVGYKGDRLAAFLTVGDSFEPRRPGTTLDGALSVGTFLKGTVYQKGPWNVDCGVHADLQFYGGGNWPMHISAGCGVGYDLAMGAPSNKNGITEPVTALSGAPSETSDKPYTFEVQVVNFERPVYSPYKNPPKADPNSKDQQDYYQIYDAMKKAAARNAWGSILDNKYCEKIKVLMTKGVQIDDNAFKICADTGQSYGEPETVEEWSSYVNFIGTEDSLGGNRVGTLNYDARNSIRAEGLGSLKYFQSHGYVSISVDLASLKKVVELQWSGLAGPYESALFARVVETLKRTGSYEGMLPPGTYTLKFGERGAETFVVEDPTKQVRVSVERH